ncbi:GMP synthase [Ectothiorhodospiraceae bacterium 2226]|nr:GMP synthase [Ectothiorhodospiraceae bacterium 2226]
MKRYSVIQNTYSEFLGLIETQLEKRDIGFNYLRPFVDQALPASALQFDGLFVLAGSKPPTDAEGHAWLGDALHLIQVYQKAKRPVVGIGLGGQLVARVAGGEAHAEPYHRSYWTTAHATEAGKDDPLAQAVDGRRVLIISNGRVTLPGGVEPLVVDDDGEWLVIRPNELTYGMLLRPEMKPGMIEDMIMEEDRDTPDNIGELLETARAEWGGMQEMTDQVVVALVKGLDLMHERRKAPVFSLKVENK